MYWMSYIQSLIPVFLFYVEEESMYSPLCQHHHVFTCPSVSNMVLYYICD